MGKQRVVAIVGSKLYHNLPAIKQVITEKIRPGDKVLTGDLGEVNQEVRKVVMERGNVALKIISAAEHGEDKANEITIQECDEVIIFCGNAGKAVHLKMLARHYGKPFMAVDDMEASIT